MTGVNTYTLVAHSGLGDCALESYHVSGRRETNAVQAAGGVLLDGYALAEEVAFAMVRYRPGQIVPAGVSGTLSATRFRGLRLWVPDSWARTVLRLGVECGWDVPLTELTELADAVMAAPAP